MDLSRYRELYLAETREHVSAINRLLLELEAEPAAAAPVEGLFRAVHTLKGMAASMGYAAVEELAHALEDLLALLRRGERAVDDELLSLLFRAADALEEAGLEPATEEVGVGHGALLARLRSLRDGSDGMEARGGVGALAVGADAPLREGELAVEVRFAPDAPLPGVRAFLLLRRARALGEVGAVQPAEESLQGAEFDGALRFRLRSELPPERLREELASVGEVHTVELHTVELHAAARAEAPAAAAPLPAPGPASRQVRVDAARLDALLNRVGELVVLRERLRRVAEAHPAVELQESVEQASRLIDELQHEITRVRLVPVAEVFERFPRLVRDAALALGKRVRLETDGAELEFDRSLLDAMSEPLLHLLRNAVDHGIERPEERRRAGKPEVGRVRLSALRERSSAVLRVQDDGRGVQRERVLVRAVANGLVAAHEAPSFSDADVARLLLRPGFSTAERLTAVSGRGVGLDVVATRVRSVGGTLDVASTPGAGTTVTLRLPLTLAIAPALLVGLGAETYALPLAHVVETRELEPTELRQAGPGRVALCGDEILPLLELRRLLRYPAAAPAPRTAVVVLEAGERWVALAVDRFVGQREVVVKAYDHPAAAPRLFSGATLLADGQPALILDVGSLVAS